MPEQAIRTTMEQSIRHRVTTAEVNAGHTIVAAVPGQKFRVTGIRMIALEGDAETATSVDILATQSSASVRLFVVGVAGLTDSAVVTEDNANVAILADGASFAENDANTAITIGTQSGGSDLATCTGIDVILSYVAVEA